MQTFYLRFSDADEATTALQGAGWQTGTERATPPDGFRWDAIGAIETQPATVDIAGVEITAAVIDNRYHVNIYVEGGQTLPAAFDQWRIPAPVNPKRVFGG